MVRAGTHNNNNDNNNEGTNAMNNTDKILFTPAETAVILGIGRSKVYEFLQNGQLASVKIGRSRRIHAKEIDAFIKLLMQRGVA
jgi:excisionase family DNA binding protein